jgi:hypothetical protein
MKALATVLALSAAPVAAQEVTFTETPDGIVATYHNEVTMWGTLDAETYAFEIEAGTVVMVLHRTQNDSCEPQPCADWLEVIETPPGMVAVPAQVELPETETTTVRIFVFNGT